MTQFSVSSTPYLQCVAVSLTADATGSWYRYSFKTNYFPDYPKLGTWPDSTNNAYLITFNMFNGNSFVGAAACALDRANLLAGNPPRTPICHQYGSGVASLLPADVDGATVPPSGAPGLFLDFTSGRLNLYQASLNWGAGSGTFTGPTSFTVGTFSLACGGGACIPQKSTKEKLDSLGDRLMYRLAYRNFGTTQSMVVNHSVNLPVSGVTVTGIRWYQLTKTTSGAWTLAQQSTFAPDTTFRWMGSIAMDKVGNIAVGYSASSSSIYPAIRLTGRVPGDATNTLENETTIFNGTGSQLQNLNRWGDYSSISVDPVDDCTFWYSNEYLKSSGTFNWNTRIATFKFPSCH